MSAPFEDLAKLDRLIHEPARLAITSALASCERADFLFLQRLTGLSKGNLSSHLSRLEDAGIVEVEKTFEGKTPRTWLQLTSRGREAVARYWKRMEAMRVQAESWSPDPDDGDSAPPASD